MWRTRGTGYIRFREWLSTSKNTTTTRVRDAVDGEVEREYSRLNTLFKCGNEANVPRIDCIEALLGV